MGFVLFMADVSIMAYIYKSYYGRSIINEIGDDEKWLWDDETHKFYSINKIKVYKDELEKDNNAKILKNDIPNNTSDTQFLPAENNLIEIMSKQDKSILSKKSKKSNKSKNLIN